MCVLHGSTWVNANIKVGVGLTTISRRDVARVPDPCLVSGILQGPWVGLGGCEALFQHSGTRGEREVKKLHTYQYIYSEAVVYLEST